MTRHSQPATWPWAPTNRIARRHLLTGIGAAVLALSLPGRPTRRAVAATQPAPNPNPRFAAYPFPLGVASGEPLPDGVVLWTRLAPAPLDGGGMPPEPVAVRWEVAADDGFRDVVQTGETVADPFWAHSVHVEVSGLEPGRVYWYRFAAGAEVSPTGRTKTAPATNAPLDRLRFAFASCQDYQAGYYAAHRHLAAEDLDFVLFLGDYVYEYGPQNDQATDQIVRPHPGGETQTLDEYRNRHALYKLDPDLQASHAAFPWIVTWDDHEVQDDYAGFVSAHGVPPDAFTPRRIAAYQAYYEHLPLRPSAMPVGPDLPLYRRFGFGDLAEFSVLDTRQYRSPHPCGDYAQPRCAAALDPAATMTGETQEAWLLDGLGASTARWNAIAQQVMMAQLELRPGGRDEFWGDLWDGYPVARNRILGHLQKAKIANPVVLTGDIHSTWISDLKANFANERSAVVATEFVGTSITSRFPFPAAGSLLLPENPHIRYVDGESRGYARCEITPETWRTDLRAVSDVTDPEATVSTSASFLVEDGRPGVREA